MTNRTLIKNARLITMDPKLGVVDQGDILIEDDRILEVGDNLDAELATVIDASNTIAIPGLVNTHIHVWQSAVKGLAGDQTFYYYLENVLSKLGAAFSADELYLANLVGSLEAIDSGTTTVLDWCHAISTPDHADRAIDGLEESGIRAVWAYGPPPSFDYWSPESQLPHPDDARRIRESRLSSDDGHITMALGTRGSIWMSYDVNVRDVEFGRELDVIVSEHAGLPGKVMVYNHEDIIRRGREGYLDQKMNFVHANDCNAEEYKVLADHGCSVSVTAQSEMHLGFGPSGIGLCLEAGMQPVLGTDVASQCTPDMFTEMRVSLQWQRYLEGRAKLADTGDLPAEVDITTKDMLEFATIGGARALGLDDRIGSLTPGKQADIVLIRTDALTTRTSQDPYQTVVLYASAATVDTVLVAGKCLKRNGKLTYSALDARIHEIGIVGDRIFQAVTAA